jgi:integrase
VWRDDGGEEIGVGRYWRRNHKNKHCEPCWFPMEPEFRTIVLRWISANPVWRDCSAITGKIWGLSKAMENAAERAGLHRLPANLGLRRSFATMLASRGYAHEYIRQAMGHEGQVLVSPHFKHASAPGGDSRSGIVAVARPTILDRHYMRASPDMFRRSLKGRR